ncbi:DUF1841 family protein [Sulfuricaulis sp.]|jgi:hypothetical protein|uniref:DUF1841 family protein n=1 Tax=Sulfuricaulis sp. TaxID=2003553 RepID=UPI003559CA05
MFSGQDRGQTREVFFRAWRAHHEGRPLEGVEKLIVQVVLRHPEYHSLLEHPEPARERDYFPESGETNPFLHLGMHIAIEEQLSIDQPRGIRGYYQKILMRLPDEHAAQHHMMECLGEMLWQASRQATAPQETVYLDCLKRLLAGPSKG